VTGVNLRFIFTPDVVEAVEELVDARLERKLAELDRDEWHPIPVAARKLGCSPAALRERIRAGTVPASRMSRRLYVKQSDINEILERGRR
jgi:hypothetical protein